MRWGGGIRSTSRWGPQGWEWHLWDCLADKGLLMTAVLSSCRAEDGAVQGGCPQRGVQGSAAPSAPCATSRVCCPGDPSGGGGVPSSPTSRRAAPASAPLGMFQP